MRSSTIPRVISWRVFWAHRQRSLAMVSSASDVGSTEIIVPYLVCLGPDWVMTAYSGRRVHSTAVAVCAQGSSTGAAGAGIWRGPVPSRRGRRRRLRAGLGLQSSWTGPFGCPEIEDDAGLRGARVVDGDVRFECSAQYRDGVHDGRRRGDVRDGPGLRHVGAPGL
jgi:hypothetical protein